MRYRNVCTLAIHVDSHVFACSHARNVRENKRFPRLAAYLQFSELILVLHIKGSPYDFVGLFAAEENAFLAFFSSLLIIIAKICIINLIHLLTMPLHLINYYFCLIIHFPWDKEIIIFIK